MAFFEKKSSQMKPRKNFHNLGSRREWDLKLFARFTLDEWDYKNQKMKKMEH